MINEMKLDKSAKLSGEELDSVVAGVAASFPRRTIKLSKEDLEKMRRSMLEKQIVIIDGLGLFD